MQPTEEFAEGISLGLIRWGRGMLSAKKEEYIGIIKEVYNNIFDSSFSISLDNRIYGVIGAYSYDKSIDKIISHGTGGTASFYEIVILESKEENNLYKVKFVEGTFSPGGKWMSLDIDSNEDISDESEAKSVVKRNKDK